MRSIRILEKPCWLLLCSLLFLVARPTHAQETFRSSGVDYLAGFGFRTMPLGAAAYGEAGYGHHLWGAYENKDDVFYGYLRPAARWTSAITINSVDLTLTLRPVSFLGLTVGRVYTHRSRDESKNADCNVYQCDGILRGDYGIVSLLLGAKGVFLASDLSLTDFRPSGDGEDFYEDGAALIGRRGYDRLFSQTHTIGVQIENPWLKEFFIGFGARRTEAHLSGGFSERASIVGGHKHGELTWTYAAGMHRSALQGSAPAFGIAVEWNGRQGLRLN